MTDPTPQTPTRDEAVLLPCPFCGSEAEIERYGDRRRSTIYRCTSCSCSLETCEEWSHGRAWNERSSAPAPASGGVDAVAVKALFWNEYETEGEVDRWDAETAAGTYYEINREFDGYYLSHDHLSQSVGPFDSPDAAKAAAQADYEKCIRSALSPAATPRSEAGGGGPTYVVNCCNCGRIIDTREKSEGGDDFGSEVSDDRWVCSPECWDAVVEPDVLAKPAYSPAPVRPIGNQGISDYQREIARNMAEGFAAWNAARQEALPSDEPASSPAGGDVVQTLIDKTEKLIEAADDMGWSCNSSSADQAIREARDAVRAALSQSTSAGRVGE